VLGLQYPAYWVAACAVASPDDTNAAGRPAVAEATIKTHVTVSLPTAAGMGYRPIIGPRAEGAGFLRWPPRMISREHRAGNLDSSGDASAKIDRARASKVAGEAEDSPAERDAGLTDAGSDPDPRVKFANTRTFLAWNRTALALIAGGLAVAQFLKLGLGGARLIVALPLIVLGAAMSFSSYRQWERNERAFRRDEPLPPSALPQILAYGLMVIALAAVVLAVIRVA
jgi:putative membrane protein